ncbi:MAG: aminodeoxychorismate/anthranilate synthase component II [Bacteroidota bacterium]
MDRKPMGDVQIDQPGLGIKVLLIDNYDSFTYNLYDYLLQTGADCTVVRNDALSLEAFQLMDFDALVLSPGPGRPSESGLLMDLVAQFIEHVPVLGICLGHQAIGKFYGAELIKAREPVHGKTSSIIRNTNPIFEGLPDRFPVMRYHSLILKSLEGTPLRPIAWTADQEIMAFCHEELPVIGFQFHPESILTAHGLELIQHWLRHYVPHPTS